MNYAILLSGGTGTRTGADTPKRYVRLNGQMKPIDNSFVTNEEAKKMAYACMGDREKRIFEQCKPKGYRQRYSDRYTS